MNFASVLRRRQWDCNSKTFDTNHVQKKQRLNIRITIRESVLVACNIMFHQCCNTITLLLLLIREKLKWVWILIQRFNHLLVWKPALLTMVWGVVPLRVIKGLMIVIFLLPLTSMRVKLLIFVGIMVSFTISSYKYSQYLMVNILSTNLLYLIREYSFWSESTRPKVLDFRTGTLHDVDPRVSNTVDGSQVLGMTYSDILSFIFRHLLDGYYALQ